MKHRFARILLVLLAVLLLPTAVVHTVDAAEPNALELVWNTDNSLSVYLTAASATNGRLVISYDGKLTPAQITPGSYSWIVSTNTETRGQLSFAWVASRLTSERTLMLTVSFDSAVTTASFRAEATELYAGKTALKLPAAATLSLNNPFRDIQGHWAEADILTAYRAGLVNGTSKDLFSPNLTLTRAMFVTMLYRMAGSPTVSGTLPFTDVKQNDYFRSAVLWGYQSGIVQGMSATSFGPELSITRQQMVTMLYRYADWDGADIRASTSLAAFSDRAQIAEYALAPMQWAVAEGIIIGNAGALRPEGTATRAESVTILVRYMG